MKMDSTSLSLFFSFLCLCLALTLTLWPPKKQRRLPPGPFPFPIVGSLFKLGTRPHIPLAQLAKIYGPLMTLKLGSVTAVIASSPAMAQQVLQKHDQAFASRTIPDAVRATNHHEFSMAWVPAASPQWRKIRKIFKTESFVAERLGSNQALRRQKVEELVAYVEQSSKQNLPVNIGQVAFSTVLNLISNTVFSQDLTCLDSIYSQEFKNLVRGVMEKAGRPNFADYFPCLSMMDPQGIRSHMEEYFLKLDELFDAMIEKRMKDRTELGSCAVSSRDFLDAILDYKQEDGVEFSDPDIKSMLKVSQS